jgi:putative transposase
MSIVESKSMAKKRRHAADEIAAKLREADALAVAGRSQSEIAKALGISVMTFHRWRKARPQLPGLHETVPKHVNAVAPTSGAERAARIAELQLENARLRKLVTDLLLEKMRLEDERAGRSRAS